MNYARCFIPLVVVIDDSPEDRETYRRFLLEDQQYNYQIKEEEYGEKGLELCRANQPDVILLDYKLPDIDGLSLLQELQSNLKDGCPPVVILTGQGNEAIAVEAMKQGAKDYLVKQDITAQSLQYTIHNILEKVSLRQQLEKKEIRFRTSIENMLDCFGIYTSIRDESGKIVDFQIEYMNAAACHDNCTIEAGEIGKRLSEINPMYLENGLFAEYCRVVETGEPLEKESVIWFENIDKQRAIKILDIRATKLEDGLVASWRNITEKKQAEERLKKQQHLIEQITIATPDLLYLYDLEKQENIYVNRKVSELLGYTSEEIQQIDKGSFAQIVHPDDLERYQDWMKKIESAKDGEVLEFEYRLRHANGEWRWVNIRSTVFGRASDGSVVQILGIARDITERKHTETERARLLEEAKAANQAKDLFLSIVSHELRNPLNAILGYTHLLRQGNLDRANADKSWGIIERSVKLQAQMIDDLLDISRITSGKLRLDRKRIDLVATIEAAIDTMRLSAQAREIVIEANFDLSAVWVWGDTGRLQQIVENLLANAIKFTPAGGYIQLTHQRVEDWVEVSVTDTGRGISPEFLPHVFERFQQEEKLGELKGLGLGLAIVHHLVELHGGSIWAQSLGENRGATFTFRLPSIDLHRD